MKTIIVKNKKRILLSAFFGLLLSVCLLLGYRLNKWGTVFGNPLLFLFFLLIFFVSISAGCFFLFGILDKKTVSVEPDTVKQRKNSEMWIYALVVFVLWLPAFFAVYPGWFNYDALWQLSMYQSGEISAHHPVLHTVFLGWIIETVHSIRVSQGDWAYNYNFPVAVYTLIQMLLCAIGMGYLIASLGRFLVDLPQKTRRILEVVCLLFFGLYPPIVLLVMSPTKDVFFGICFAILTVMLYALLSGKSKNVWFLWPILAFLCIVLRQNSLYAFLLVSIPLGCILGKKQGKEAVKKYIYGVVVVLMLLIVYKGPVYHLFNVEAGSKAEFLSVPCQQLIKVYKEHGDELSKEQSELIEKLFEKEAFLDYRSKLADATKGALRMDFLEENKTEFVKLYFSLACSYPKDYLDAFLVLNYGFWYPDACLDLYEDGKTLFFAATHSIPVYASGKIPFLLDFYRQFESGKIVQSGSVTTWFLMPAVWIYLVVFSLLYLTCKRDACGMLVSVLTLLVWLTFLLGPCVSIRYVFFLYVMAPVFMGLVIKKKG